VIAKPVCHVKKFPEYRDGGWGDLSEHYPRLGGVARFAPERDRAAV